MLLSATLFLLTSAGSALANVLNPEHKPRIFVLSDMANEPDDAESLVRLLLYANEIDIEGLVATTSTWLRTSTHEEQIHNVLDGYALALPSLQAHAPSTSPYPSSTHLASLTHSHLPLFGLAAVGPSGSSPGSAHLIARIDARDPHDRPLFVQLWGGGNCLAQALWEVRETRSRGELEEFMRKMRVYAISDQDDTGPWVRREFPEVQYIASVHGENQYALATWTGISGDNFYGFTGGEQESITMDWVREHIQLGPLGSKYPDFDFIPEGDTPAFLGTIPNGLNYPLDPTFGGWGGRYTKPLDCPTCNHYADVVDRVISPVDLKMKMSGQASIWRWRTEYQNDFRARMQWTLSKEYAAANHPPSVIVNGDDTWQPIRITTTAGSTITIDASQSSDPDGDKLVYEWFQYKEVGSIQNEVDKEVPTLETHGTERTERLRMTLPESIEWNGRFKETRDFHIILKVTDDGIPALTRYRRVILTVLPKREEERRKDEL